MQTKQHVNRDEFVSMLSGFLLSTREEYKELRQKARLFQCEYCDGVCMCSSRLHFWPVDSPPCVRLCSDIEFLTFAFRVRSGLKEVHFQRLFWLYTGPAPIVNGISRVCMCNAMLKNPFASRHVTLLSCLKKSDLVVLCFSKEHVWTYCCMFDSTAANGNRSGFLRTGTRSRRYRSFVQCTLRHTVRPRRLLLVCVA
jgi:hypothetical protein